MKSSMLKFSMGMSDIFFAHSSLKKKKTLHHLPVKESGVVAGKEGDDGCTG